MPLLSKDMSRSKAESVLGLKHSHTNNGFVWKYSLPTNQAVFLWFEGDRDPKTGVWNINGTLLSSATLDFHSVTSRIPELWMGMSLDEVETALGVQLPQHASASSSGWSITYQFEDLEYPQPQSSEHNLTVRFSHDFQKFFDAPPSDADDPLKWVRANGHLIWLWVDDRPVDPPKKRLR